MARLIGGRATLSAKRQIFLVQLGGFDTHGGLSEVHPRLIDEVGAAMKAFHDATVELGIADKITTFTASEFGRLLPTTSVDQFAGTLARWFGVPDSELDTILPKLRNFDVNVGAIGYPRNLGFL